ncbi:MAG TPA: hypothetical protein PKK06_17310 [Phycisphaerae bacterium]|nr:hypothetical protein [Phycisphaerae bacterium]HNU46942.1 hypothetical protein [Phycisphaerae bacterium]
MTTACPTKPVIPQQRRKHVVRWTDASADIVWRALNTPIVLPSARRLPMTEAPAATERR